MSFWSLIISGISVDFCHAHWHFIIQCTQWTLQVRYIVMLKRKIAMWPWLNKAVNITRPLWWRTEKVSAIDIMLQLNGGRGRGEHWRRNPPIALERCWEHSRTGSEDNEGDAGRAKNSSGKSEQSSWDFFKMILWSCLRKHFLS